MEWRGYYLDGQTAHRQTATILLTGSGLKVTTEREKTLTVRNLTNTSLTVLKPEYTGTDRSAFSTDAGCTNVVLAAGRSCTLKVTLSPTGPLKTYKANLVLEAKELPQATEVPVEASTLL